MKNRKISGKRRSEESTVKMPTASSKFTSFNLHKHLFIAAIIFNFFVVFASSDRSIPQELGGGGRGLGLRSLKSFKEKKSGTNVTFDCSPSGPCVPCQYSEKKDDSYRCSETGYRIPMKCSNVETHINEKNEKNDKKKQKGRTTLENTKEKLKLHAEDPTTSIRHRNLLEKSSSREEDESRVYITYRSCIPAINEEKLSVLGFEAIILLLLASSLFVIFRRKGTLIMPGAVRVPTNSRF